MLALLSGMAIFGATDTALHTFGGVAVGVCVGVGVWVGVAVGDGVAVGPGGSVHVEV